MGKVIGERPASLPPLPLSSNDEGMKSLAAALLFAAIVGCQRPIAEPTSPADIAALIKICEYERQQYADELAKEREQLFPKCRAEVLELLKKSDELLRDYPPSDEYDARITTMASEAIDEKISQDGHSEIVVSQFKRLQAAEDKLTAARKEFER